MEMEGRVIVGVGLDVIEVARMEAVLRRHPERAAARLFTAAERAACARRARPAECFAARFAAKEALLKALGCGLGGGLSWRDMEVAANERGDPHLVLSGAARALLRRRGGTRTHLSFSHDAGIAAAVVVVEAD